MLMDRVCEGDETRQLVLDLGFEPAALPKTNRKAQWDDDQDLYKRRNEVERLFRRPKGFSPDLLTLREAQHHVQGFLELRSNLRHDQV